MELDWIWIGGTSYPIGYTSYRVDILRIVERTTYGGHTAYGGRTVYGGYRSKRYPVRYLLRVKYACRAGN